MARCISPSCTNNSTTTHSTPIFPTRNMQFQSMRIEKISNVLAGIRAKPIDHHAMKRAIFSSNRCGFREIMDIGGGYEENECRLSDATLRWMITAATTIPHPIELDRDVLITHPSPDGRSHDEVKSGLGITTLTGWTWAEQQRDLPVDKKTKISKATMHESVYRRFDLRKAFEYDAWAPYRPRTLRNHVDFARYYEPDATFPATSLRSATAMADDPLARKKKQKKKRRIR